MLRQILQLICICSITVIAGNNGLLIRNEHSGVTLMYGADGNLLSTKTLTEGNSQFSNGLKIISVSGKRLASFEDESIKLVGHIKEGESPTEDNKAGLRFSHTNNKYMLFSANVGDLYFNGSKVPTYAGEPYNWAKVTTYRKPNQLESNTSITYTTGLGLVAQQQVQHNTSQWLVSFSDYDSRNRVTKAYLSTPYYSAGTYVSSEQLYDPAKKTYDDDKPYVEYKYLDQNHRRPVEVGGAGSAYNVATGKIARQWTFGVDANTSFLSYSAVRNIAALDQKSDVSDAQYILTVACDPDDRFTQIITDKFGLKLATWSDTSNGTSANGVAIVRYEYDEQNRLKKVIPADPSLLPTTYTYNDLNLVETKSTPDAGTTKYEYFINGTLKSETRSLGTTNELRIAYEYDHLNRPITTKVGGEAVKSLFHTKSIALAGLSDIPSAETIINQLTNLRGNEVGTKFKDQGKSTCVVDLFSYDDENRIAAAFRFISGFGWTKKEMSYTFAGDLEKVTITPRYLGSDQEEPISISYSYDPLGNLSTVDCSDKGRLVSYEYALTGELTKKNFHNGSTAVIASESYEENIRGWPTKIVSTSRGGSELFSQNLSYDGSYSGNITKSVIAQAGFPTITQNFRYNGVNTLTNVTSNTSAYNESFAYDLSGRMKSKTTGGVALTYTYQNGTSKITSAGSYSYQYDTRGNVTRDILRNTGIEYSWNNMPYSFTPPGGGGKVEMRYDGGNNRVLKEERTLDRTRGTLYTANLVYTNTDLLMGESYNRDYYTIETPMGTEGRIEFDNSGNKSAFFYVTDHLGSTRAVLGENGEPVYAANYTAYGEQKLLKTGVIDVRENFTGKEFDTDGGDQNGKDGMNYTYFGSRYLDNVTGVWLSTDPAEQFYNPYAYATNPVMFVDPDGEYIVGKIIGAVVGGYVGGARANGSINPRDWDWESGKTYMGIAGGAIRGGKRGNQLENSMIASSIISKGYAATKYGFRAETSWLQDGSMPGYAEQYAEANSSEQYAQRKTNGGADPMGRPDPTGGGGGAPRVSTYGQGNDPTQINQMYGHAGSKVIVVGETMGRVKGAAQLLRSNGVNAKWYQTWGKNFPKNRLMRPEELSSALARNQRWLISKIKSGYKIYDIGYDATRAMRSSFYKLEQSILDAYHVPVIR